MKFVNVTLTLKMETNMSKTTKLWIIFLFINVHLLTIGHIWQNNRISALEDREQKRLEESAFIHGLLDGAHSNTENEILVVDSILP